MRIPNKRNIRIGERRKNNSNLWMEIIEYRNQGDLDVRFDLGGAVVKHRKYDGFKNGKIKNPKYFLSRIGERYQNQNGYWFEIVGMINKTKAIIKFDDFDDLVIWDNYYHITHVKHPQETKVIPLKRKSSVQLINRYWKEIRKKQTDRTWIGKTTINLQGLKMTIIKKTGKKIDVQFEDGTVVKDKWISTFRRACICNPNYSNSKTISRNEFSFYYYLKDYGFKHYEQGELKEYGLGQYTVDLFNPDLRVAIEYDGRFHRIEKDHRKNVAFSKRGIKIIRVREPEADEFEDGRSINFYIENGNNFDPALTKVIKKVIDYLNSNYDIKISQNIDVVRDKNRILQQYLNETDYLLRNKRIGKRYKNNQDLWFEIIDYRSAHDIDIKFDIDGLILQTNFKAIKSKQIPHPKYNRTYFDRKKRLGEKNINNHGLSMTIVKYRNSTDIDVELEDGTIVKHVEYHNFQRGQVNPVKKKRKGRNGEIGFDKLGRSMKIIRWGGSKDIDVELEDGTIFKHKDYRTFKNGAVFKQPIENRIGQRFKTNKGLWIEVINYRNTNDVDIRFDIDGTVLKHKDYQSIKKGILPHPKRIDLLGNKIINHEGLEMELIKYRSCKDVDVLFTKDNSILKHQRYYKFKDGSLGYPKK